MHYEIPINMQAIGLSETDGHLTLKQVAVPKPGKGEVLVKMAAAPMNPSDLARIKNLSDPSECSSFIAGIEGSGTVVSHGAGLLPRLWLGKRVACSSSHNTSGSWAEYMVASAMGCVPLPKDISDEQGAMMLVNPLTAVAFFEIIRRNRHKAVINTAAASSLSKIITLLGKKHHIPIIHVVRNEKQKDSLLEQGAGYVLDSSAGGFSEDLRTLAKKLQATLILDAVGGSFSRQLLMAVPFGSTHIIYGNLSGEQPELDHKSLITDSKKVFGFYLVNWLREQGMFTMLRSIIKARQLLKREITIPVQARFPLDKAQLAMDTYLGNMSAGKVLLIPGR